MKSSYELLLSSIVVVFFLEVVAYYSGCSSSRSSDCSDYSGYLSNPGLDSDSGSCTCFGRYYLHTTPVVFGFSDSHTMLALLSSIPTDSPYYCVVLCKTHRSPIGYSE